jgi:hypothetical protein
MSDWTLSDVIERSRNAMESMLEGGANIPRSTLIPFLCTLDAWAGIARDLQQKTADAGALLARVAALEAELAAAREKADALDGRVHETIVRLMREADEREWGLDTVFAILAFLHDRAEVGEAWDLWTYIPGPLGVLLACVECGLVKQSKVTDCEEWYRITPGGETWLRRQLELSLAIKAQYGEEGEK